MTRRSPILTANLLCSIHQPKEEHTAVTNLRMNDS
jgi:hypothetical protein